MIVLIIIVWLILGLIGSRLEYLFLKAPWTEGYHRRVFKREHLIISSVSAIFGVCNFLAGVILYFFLRTEEMKIK